MQELLEYVEYVKGKTSYDDYNDSGCGDAVSSDEDMHSRYRSKDTQNVSYDDIFDEWNEFLDVGGIRKIQPKTLQKAQLPISSNAQENEDADDESENECIKPKRAIPLFHHFEQSSSDEELTSDEEENSLLANIYRSPDATSEMPSTNCQISDTGLLEELACRFNNLYCEADDEIPKEYLSVCKQYAPKCLYDIYDNYTELDEYEVECESAIETYLNHKLSKPTKKVPKPAVARLSMYEYMHFINVGQIYQWEITDGIVFTCSPKEKERNREMKSILKPFEINNKYVFYTDVDGFLRSPDYTSQLDYSFIEYDENVEIGEMDIKNEQNESHFEFNRSKYNFDYDENEDQYADVGEEVIEEPQIVQEESMCETNFDEYNGVNMDIGGLCIETTKVSQNTLPLESNENDREYVDSFKMFEEKPNISLDDSLSDSVFEDDDNEYMDIGGICIRKLKEASLSKSSIDDNENEEIDTREISAQQSESAANPSLSEFSFDEIEESQVSIPKKVSIVKNEVTEVLFYEFFGSERQMKIRTRLRLLRVAHEPDAPESELLALLDEHDQFALMKKVDDLTQKKIRSEERVKANSSLFMNTIYNMNSK